MREPETFATNPCCCFCRLQSGVLCIGITGIVVYSIHVILYGLGVETSHDAGLEVAYFFKVVESLIFLALAILLTVGACQRSVTLIKICFIAGIVLFILEIIGDILFVVQVVLSDEKAFEKKMNRDGYKNLTKVGFLGGWIPCFMIALGIDIYVLYVIYAYMKQLTRTGYRVNSMEGPYPVGEGRPAYNPSHPKAYS